MLEHILRKTRVDGNIDSPVRYLTKEDGGKNFSSVEEFESYYSRSDEEFNWIPKLNACLTRNDVGYPGEYIAKISSSIKKNLGTELVDWRDYLSTKLYRGFEHNIKYYPIGRHTDNCFPDSVKTSLGKISKHEYEAYIRDHKSVMFQNLFNESPAKINIVFAAESEWSEVFRRIHGDLVIENCGDHIHIAKDLSGKLVYIYFPVFGRYPGSRNSRAEKVSKIAAEKLRLKERSSGKTR